MPTYSATKKRRQTGKAKAFCNSCLKTKKSLFTRNSSASPSTACSRGSYPSTATLSPRCRRSRSCILRSSSFTAKSSQIRQSTESGQRVELGRRASLSICLPCSLRSAISLVSSLNSTRTSESSKKATTMKMHRFRSAKMKLWGGKRRSFW